MALVTALVDIGQQWPAGETRDVAAGRAVLMVNAGYAELFEEPSQTKTAKSANTNKEQ